MSGASASGREQPFACIESRPLARPRSAAGVDDSACGSGRSLRESADDYRYLPEPGGYPSEAPNVCKNYDQLRSCLIIGVERTRLPVAK